MEKPIISLENKVIKKFLMKKRPPEHIRDKLDIDVRKEGQSILVLELRPRWDNPEEILDLPIAKATYVKSRKIWKIYWKRADLKWHVYDPTPEVTHLSDFLDIVDRDSHGCFWG